MPRKMPSPVCESITRAPRQNSEKIVAVTNTPKKIAMNEYASEVSCHGRIPKATSRMAAAAEMTAGTAKFRRKLSSDVFRQESNGPNAVRTKRPRKIGIVTRLKNGGPTVTLVPCTHSDKRGKSVPHRMVKHAASSSRLLKRKLDSRETTASNLFSLLRCSRFLIKKNRHTTKTEPRKIPNQFPIGDCANACTDEMMPLRVSSVPNIESMKVMKISHTFHTFSMPRFSCIITECRNAVPVIQGISEASSTGSHPQ